MCESRCLIESYPPAAVHAYTLKGAITACAGSRGDHPRASGTDGGDPHTLRYWRQASGAKEWLPTGGSSGGEPWLLHPGPPGERRGSPGGLVLGLWPCRATRCRRLPGSGSPTRRDDAPTATPSARTKCSSGIGDRSRPASSLAVSIRLARRYGPTGRLRTNFAESAIGTLLRALSPECRQSR
jgi:hypothetical protein